MSRTPQVSGGPSPPAQSARTRQIVYAAAIVLLFGAMWPYSEWLNRVKKSEDLGEAAIGQVDAGGFMLKLAMIGGFRGIVADILWFRADELKRAHEWDQLKLHVDLITKLQPHFLSVWTFQGWNLSYNVAAEWDAPEDKYVWIKKGINFLKEGVAKNSGGRINRASDLMWDTAWTYYNKIGFADEAILLRRLFLDDPDDDGSRFKVDPIERSPRNDNFQVAHGWFTLAVRTVDEGGERTSGELEARLDHVDPQLQRKGRPGDLNFRAMPAHAQTRYAISLEKQSIKDYPATFDELAQAEWQRAYDAWLELGHYPFPAFRYPEQKVFLDDATVPERFEALTEVQKYWARRWADQENYPYWKDRATAEMDARGVEARRLFYQATLATRAADFPEAAKKYGQGLKVWDELLKEHPTFRNDFLNQKDTGHIVKRYERALKQVGEPLPEDTPFRDLLAAVRNDVSLDPFDQLDMMRSTTAVGGGAGKPGPGGSSPR